MSLVRFTKMHGLGNDFMIVDATQGGRTDWPPELIKKLSCRHTGVGFDQFLLICSPRASDVDFNYRIINGSDGHEVGQCGNGVRCLARFVRDNKLTNKNLIRLQTANTLVELRIAQNGLVTVNMGEPLLDPEKVPFVATARNIEYILDLDGRAVSVMVVSMGNPHAVMLVDDVDLAPVKEIGPKVEQHSRFPDKCNAGFMQVVSSSEIRLRVYERAAGETMACGSGACAAVVAGILRGLLDKSVTVHFHIGDLQISWQGEGHPVMMTGPSTHVYDGEVRV